MAITMIVLPLSTWSPLDGFLAAEAGEGGIDMNNLGHVVVFLVQFNLSFIFLVI